MLCLRVTAANVKGFVPNYSVAGRERRVTIGRWQEWTADAACNEAIRLRADIAEAKGRTPAIREGGDPVRDRDLARGEPLVSDLAEDYLQRYAVPKKRARA